MDADGYHLLACSSHRGVPHDVLQDTVHELCGAARLSAVVEPVNCLTAAVSTSSGRPDLLIPGAASGGKDLLVDFTTADAAAKSSLRSPWCSYCFAGAPGEAAELRKVDAYKGKFDPARFAFQPAALEISGRVV